ncbi:MAG TPA: acyl carrier protein [Planctomycetota bacterium]|nr:acyl carrier protein [Planctomycetota bacterium]
MTTPEGIEKSVKEIVAKVLKIPLDTVKLESRFRDDLGADSLDLVLLLYELEDQLELKLSDDEAKSIQSVADAVKLAEQVAHP